MFASRPPQLRTWQDVKEFSDRQGQGRDVYWRARLMPNIFAFSNN